VRGFDALVIYAWAYRALLVVLGVVCAIAIILVARRRRKAAVTAVDATLIGVVLAGAAVVYLPLALFTFPHTDRLHGRFDAFVPSFRLLFATVLVTVVAHAMFIIASRSRHTPEATRRTALVVAAVTCGLVLNLLWIPAIFPVDGWWPSDWQRTDRMGPLRACRGATLWEVSLRRDGEPFVYPIGRIDDLWLQFADPSAGRPIRAISFVGNFREGYFWLSMSEANALRVRVDDPALKDCHGTWRRDPVAPAPWHKIGWPERGGRHRG